MEHAIKYYTKINCFKNKIKDNELIKSIVDKNLDDIRNNHISFSQLVSITKYKKNKKLRVIAKISDKNKVEFVLLQYLKSLLLKKCNINFSTRQCTMTLLLDKLKIIKDIKEYTVVRFDFKNYFNSVSAEYVYTKYLLGLNITKMDYLLLHKLVSEIPYAFAGLPTSNILAEIIAQDFDLVLQSKFKKDALVFYSRYVDDGFIIFNKEIEKDQIINILNETINEVFYDQNVNVKKKNKVQIDFSSKKFSYLNQNNTKKILEYLGYKITLINNNSSKSMTLGITDDKIEKYNRKLINIVKENSNNIEKLRIILKLWSKRVTYTVRDKNDVKRWISKGITHNYAELRNFKLDNKTRVFLNDSVFNAFNVNNVQIPYYLKNNQSYNLLNNLLNNKAFILDKNIGVDENTLKKLVCVVNPTYNTNKKSYHDLIKELLVNCKIGY